MRPLEGIRVLDLSRLVAGGVTGMLLADFGADVVKVEQPGTGDPMRSWTVEGQPFWWKVYARNKRCVTLDVKSAAGRDLVLRILPQFDVMIESFVPGTLERLGLGWSVLHAHNPKLVLVSISGWGQTGPGSQRPGFGTVVEAASGFAAMNGEPDRGPIVPSFPLADTSAGLYGAAAIMFALYHRDVHGGRGQVIDLTLFESLFSLLGPLPAEYGALGRVRGRDGSRSRNAGPRGCYRTRDDHWIAISGSTPKMAARLFQAYGLDHLLRDPRFANNEARVTHSRELDAVIEEAVGSRTLTENLAVIDAHQLTAGAVQTIADIERDPHWLARELTRDVTDGDGTVRMHSAVPRFSETPADVRWPGGGLGEDNDAVYEALGVSADERRQLRESGII